MGTAHFRATKLGAATQRKADDDSSAGEADGGVSQCGGVSGRAQDWPPPRTQSLCWQCHAADIRIICASQSWLRPWQLAVGRARRGPAS
jgi:hypothetical protein